MRDLVVIEKDRNCHGRRGATTVELSLIISILLILVFATIEYAMFAMTRQVVASAAQTAARTAITSTQTATTSQIQSIVTSRLTQLPLNNVSVSVYLSDSSGNNLGSWSSARFGQSIAVKVSGTYRQSTPGTGLMPSSVPITTIALLRCEVD